MGVLLVLVLAECVRVCAFSTTGCTFNFEFMNVPVLILDAHPTCCGAAAQQTAGAVNQLVRGHRSALGSH